MAAIFDSTTRHFFKIAPIDWLKAASVETDAVEIVNVDMSAVQGSADMIMLIGKERKEAAHVELMSTYEDDLPSRVLFYSFSTTRQYKVPVRSVIILLRPEADGPAMRRTLKCVSSAGAYLEFKFEVIRMWELPADQLMSNALGILPLAFIADAKVEDLPELVRRANERIQAEASPGLAKDLWQGIENLLKLRLPEGEIMTLLDYERMMRDVPSYKLGRAEEARKILLRIGTTKFGVPDATLLATLNAVKSIERLEDLTDRILIVGSWTDLFAN